MPMPLLSLIIPVGPHDDGPLRNLLASIDRQAFPKDQLEVLIMREGNSEEARARGIAQAQGEIIGCLDADNQLLGFTFLRDMVNAAGAPGSVGAYPSHYAWFADDPPLNRYFALLGVNDPLCWWLGKADRRSWLVAPRTERVVFGRSIPSLGTNGFFVKRSAIQPFLTGFPGHIDICERMRQAGYATYTVVDAVIWHRTGDSLLTWLKKRYRYVDTLYWQRVDARDWRMVRGPLDAWHVATFALASLVVLPHLWLSLRGYRRVRDPAWFLHFSCCSGITLVYGLAFARHLLRLITCLYAVAAIRHLWRRLSPVPHVLRAMGRSSPACSGKRR